MQRRAVKIAIASMSVCAALAACQRFESGPAPTGATAGSGASQRQQLQYQQPGSAPTSAGAPGAVGGDARAGGRPSVDRTGPGSGDLGGAPAAAAPRSRQGP